MADELVKYGYNFGGGSNAASEAFFQKIKPLLNTFGITRVSNVTGLDRIGIPVVSVSRPNSRSLTVSQGKGKSLIEAKISAVMESIETYHAENIHLPMLNISFEDIVTQYPLIDISGLPRYEKKKIVPSEKTLWIQGNNLIDGSTRWVPYEAVTTDLTSFSRASSFIINSNGLASGQTHLTANLHAIFEVIERDALYKFYTSIERYDGFKIRLDTVNAENQHLVQRLKNVNISVGVWDLTTDLGIPTFICKIIDSGDNKACQVRPAYGSATHLDKEIALNKAILEAAQSRATFITGLRDDQTRKVYEQFNASESVSFWKDKIYAESFYDFDNITSHNISDDDKKLAFLLNVLKQNNYCEVVSINLTKPEFSIPVVRVLIPHMNNIAQFSQA